MNTDTHHSLVENTNTSWLEQLALDEINMEETGVVHIQKTDPEKMLEEASVKLMAELKDLFELYTHKFNEYRNQYGSEQNVRIFKISDTINDFMLFRNSLKLIVARRSADTISIGFLSNSGGLMAARLGTETSEQKIHDVRGHLGPFGHITWKFQGNDVNFPALVRHYMTEFTQLSAK